MKSRCDLEWSMEELDRFSPKYPKCFYLPCVFGIEEITPFTKEEYDIVKEAIEDEKHNES